LKVVFVISSFIYIINITKERRKQWIRTKKPTPHFLEYLNWKTEGEVTNHAKPGKKMPI